MNVLVLNGSPKKKSDTMVLTDAFLRGMQAAAVPGAGAAAVSPVHVEIVNVIEKQVKPCRGCFGCWKTGTGNCVLQDDQNGILAGYRNADVVVWSFPLYCYGMPSHLKAVLDRTIPLISMKMEVVDGCTRHVPIMDFSRLHTVVICGCGFPNYEHNFEGLDLQLKNAFGNLTTVYVPETPLLHVPEARPLALQKTACFERAGKAYVAGGYVLDPALLQEMQSLMIPKEDYLQHVNQMA